MARGAEESKVALAGLRVTRMLSADLFREADRLPQEAPMAAFVGRCASRWLVLARLLAAVAPAREWLLVLGSTAERDYGLALCAVGRGDDDDAASAQAVAHAFGLREFFLKSVDFAETEILTASELVDLPLFLERARLVELRREREGAMGTGAPSPLAPIGFGARPASEARSPESLSVSGAWSAFADPWSALVEVLAEKRAALTIHLRNFRTPPEEALTQGRRALFAVEEAFARATSDGGIGGAQAAVRRTRAVERLELLQSPLLAARLFVASDEEPSAALLSFAEVALTGANADLPAPSRLDRVVEVEPGALLAPLDAPTLDELFAPTEAISFVRTPTPGHRALPGIAISRARTTAAPLGTRTGAKIGINRDRGIDRVVALDDALRPTHTYVVGQTGTGKSTMLLQMILHDIEAGRGVAVIDPHGSLIDEVLERFPRSRDQDLVLVDANDVERPVGFNVLRVQEKSAPAYRLARDYIIDDLYGALDRAYDLRVVGGPVFESHFRGMLAILMGAEAPREPRIPNLMIFRSLYTNEKLLKALVRERSAEDLVIREFADEALAAGYEQSLKNMAPYVTSKFARFISDGTLRNIICQRRVLNIDAILNERKVLLFDLGKGRLGDYAAGLLASQIISRLRQAAFKRGPTAGDAFHVYVDEFQLVADSRFAELLAEARKFGLALTLAHQYTQQLSEHVLRAVLGNVGTMISLRVGTPDAGLLAPYYAPVIDSADLVGQSNYEAFVRTGGAEVSAFSVRLSPPPACGDAARADARREWSREAYGQPRERVETEIEETYESFRALAHEREPREPSRLL